MNIKTRQVYGLAAVLATTAAILQITAGEWFRAGTGVVLAAAMVLAAMGFPERSETNKRLYYALLTVLIVLLSVQIITRLRA